MPGTVGGSVLRVSQLLSAAVELSVMATTSEFPTVTAICYLVAAGGLQSMWSFVLAIVDAYALLVGRRLQNSRVVSLFAVGDGLYAMTFITLALTGIYIPRSDLDNFDPHICFSLCWNHCSNQQRSWGL